MHFCTTHACTHALLTTEILGFVFPCIVDSCICLPDLALPYLLAFLHYVSILPLLLLYLSAALSFPYLLTFFQYARILRLLLPRLRVFLHFANMLSSMLSCNNLAICFLELLLTCFRVSQVAVVFFLISSRFILPLPLLVSCSCRCKGSFHKVAYLPVCLCMLASFFRLSYTCFLGWKRCCNFLACTRSLYLSRVLVLGLLPCLPSFAYTLVCLLVSRIIAFLHSWYEAFFQFGFFFLVFLSANNLTPCSQAYLNNYKLDYLLIYFHALSLR